MTAPLTYAECLARLAACEPMARGERLATWRDDHRAVIATMAIPKRCWWRMYYDGGLPDFGHHIRRHAFPLRRAREERQKWKERALADCSVMEWLISRISDEDLAHLIARLKDGE